MPCKTTQFAAPFPKSADRSGENTWKRFLPNGPLQTTLLELQTWALIFLLIISQIQNHFPEEQTLFGKMWVFSKCRLTILTQWASLKKQVRMVSRSRPKTKNI